MRAVIQRVSQASVSIDGKLKARIGRGFLVLLGIETDDNEEDAQWLAGKISRLRICSDAEGKMNLDLKDSGGELLLVSQFTLHAQTAKGNRPSFVRAAPPAKALPLYHKVVGFLGDLLGRDIQTGEFGAYMQVDLTNDGPVTIFIDSKNKE